jgi:hypothetical protein
VALDEAERLFQSSRKTVSIVVNIGPGGPGLSDRALKRFRKRRITQLAPRYPDKLSASDMETLKRSKSRLADKKQAFQTAITTRLDQLNGEDLSKRTDLGRRSNRPVYVHLHPNDVPKVPLWEDVLNTQAVHKRMSNFLSASRPHFDEIAVEFFRSQ